MPSYYRIIKGIRYDRKLLESASQLTEGQGDGRVSVADAHRIWQIAQDGANMTKVERRTLHYIMDNLRITNAAKNYLYEQLSLAYDVDGLSQITEKIACEKFGINGINFQGLIPERIKAQEQLPNNKVNYAAALQAMLQALLHPSDNIESPYNIVLEVYELYPTSIPNSQEEVQKKLLIHLSNGTLHLLPIYDVTDETAEYDGFYIPEERERSEENWVFYLRLPTLSDHLWWGIVPRNGEAAYVYGFN